MSFKKRLYLSPFGYFISLVQNAIAFLHRPFMVYGFKNKVINRWMKNTRISSSTKILEKNKFDIRDGVWIGHYCVLDASNGLEIGEGVQTGSHVSIYTHSSHIAIRLLGSEYITSDDRAGYIEGSVSIGRYTFIGDSCVIFPNTSIGSGCLIKAGSIVTRDIPDYAIAAGVPAKVVGYIRDLDRTFLSNSDVSRTYFDLKVFKDYKKRIDYEC